MEPEANIAQSLRQALEIIQKPILTQEIITLFYDYYSDYYNTFTADFVTHNKELRLLPSFEEGSIPQWDELTRFAFYFSKEDARREYGEEMISKSTFNQTVKRFFPKFEYTHQSSAFLKLSEDGYYTPTGWDNDGSVYYRLTKIEKKAQNVFTASFEGFYIEEDVFSNNPMRNLKVVQENAYGQGFDGSQLAPREFKEVMRKLILDPNYSKLFTVNETVEIKFEISDNFEYLLRYVSCKRVWIN